MRSFLELLIEVEDAVNQLQSLVTVLGIQVAKLLLVSDFVKIKLVVESLSKSARTVFTFLELSLESIKSFLLY